MDAQTFLDNFGTIAEAPRGTERLRELILDLAVRGRLVEQRESEGSAGELVEHLEAERHRRASSNRSRREIDPVANNEAPFTVPPTWAWVRLPTVSSDLGQGVPTQPFSYIDVGSIDNQAGAVGETAVLSPDEAPSRARKSVERGSVIYSTVRPYLRNIAVLDRDFDPPAIASTAFAVYTPLPGVLPIWVFHCLRSPYFTSYVEAHQKGVAYPAINDGDMSRAPLPLPPTGEQERIVAKVDELVQLCDDLGDRQQARHHVTSRLRASSLDALTNAESDGDLHTAWSRIHANWEALTDHTDSIEALRQTILQLAVLGRLLPQNSGDEPVTTLLERCDNRKAELIAGGHLRRRDDRPPPARSEYNSVLPAGWSLECLERVAALAGGVAKGRKLGSRDTRVVPYLRVANVKAGELLLDEVKEIALPVDELSKYQLETGDVLLTEGGDWDKLGRSAIWRAEVPVCVHQNHIFRARPLDAGIHSGWISLFANSPVGRSYFQSKAKRTTNLASINMSELRSTPIPLPPAAEQTRILGRVALLMGQCDQLEADLRQRDSSATAVAGSAMRIVAISC